MLRGLAEKFADNPARLQQAGLNVAKYFREGPGGGGGGHGSRRDGCGWHGDDVARGEAAFTPPLTNRRS